MDVLAGPAGSDPAELTVVGGALIFVADDGVHGRELENLSLARPVD